MATDESSNEQGAAPARGALVNPYESPTSSTTPERENMQFARSARMPVGTFWIVAGIAVGVSILLTYLSQGLAMPLFLAVVTAIVRVCIITWRRSVRGLSTLPVIPLLFTSALLTLALMIGCAIAFGGICTAIVLAVGEGPPGYAATMSIAAAGGFVTFFVLFILSIKWAM